MLCVEAAADRLGAVLFVLIFPSPLPSMLRSSNNLYEGTNGFCPAATALPLVLGLICASPIITDPLPPSAPYQLNWCKGWARGEVVVLACEAKCEYTLVDIAFRWL